MRRAGCRSLELKLVPRCSRRQPRPTCCTRAALNWTGAVRSPLARHRMEAYVPLGMDELRKRVDGVLQLDAKGAPRRRVRDGLVHYGPALLVLILLLIFNALPFYLAFVLSKPSVPK